MKKYEYIFNANKKEVLEQLLKGTNTCWFSFLIMGLNARVSFDKEYIRLFYKKFYRDSFRYVFAARLTEKDSKTYLNGYWRFSVFSIVFLILWYSALIVGAITPLVKNTVGNLLVFYSFLIIFALSAFVICIASYYWGKSNMKKIIEHIERAQAVINSTEQDT